MQIDYQIQDSERNTAVVRLSRDNAYRLVAWQTLTPGAFNPAIVPGAVAEGQEAHRAWSPAHGQSLACDATDVSGETFGFFAM
jgi:hypothetical protein